ncbi:uncharacterized protein [Typha angustifolia]|uniref:uncharacterized protein n=1 Tax=Typha angustifolia TaxID=59011 RepID=UPI003C2DD4B2
MLSSFSRWMAILLLLFVFLATEMEGVLGQSTLTCSNRWSPCYRKAIKCPKECPLAKPSNPNAKACYLDCYSPKCEAVCRGRKPSCHGLGSGCYDPRFIGGDGIVFYFHGKKDEHFTLVSDTNLQINAHFIGHRPAGRTRDFTWIQALGFMFDSHTLTVEAAPSRAWDDAIDHLQLSYDSEALILPEGHLSEWKSPDEKLVLERTGSKNSIMITLEGRAEVSVNVVPITKEDDKIHNYQLPSNDSFAHLEVQFKFFALSAQVEGVLGRTYRPGFVNTAKPGVAMPIVGGEDKYRTSSLVSPDCRLCLFSPKEDN